MIYFVGLLPHVFATLNLSPSIPGGYCVIALVIHEPKLISYAPASSFSRRRGSSIENIPVPLAFSDAPIDCCSGEANAVISGDFTSIGDELYLLTCAPIF